MSSKTTVVKNLRTAIRSSLNMAGNTNAAVRQDRWDTRMESQGQDRVVDHGLIVTDRDAAVEKDPTQVRRSAGLAVVMKAELEKYGIVQWSEADFADPDHVADQVLLAKAIVEQAGDAPGQGVMRQRVLEAATKLGQACPELVHSTFKGAVKAAAYPALDAEWLSAARQAADREVTASLRAGVVNTDLEAQAESLAEREASSMATAPVAGVIARAFAWKFQKDVLELIQGTVLDIVGSRRAKRCSMNAPAELRDQAWADAMAQWRKGYAVFAAQVVAALNRKALPAGKLILTGPDGSMYGVESPEGAEELILDVCGKVKGVIDATVRWSKDRKHLKVTLTWDTLDPVTEENEQTTPSWGIAPHPGVTKTMKGCYTYDLSGRKVVAGIVECPVEDLDVAAAVAKASVDAVKAGPDRSFEVGGVTYTVFDL